MRNVAAVPGVLLGHHELSIVAVDVIICWTLMAAKTYFKKKPLSFSACFTRLVCFCLIWFLTLLFAVHFLFVT